VLLPIAYHTVIATVSTIGQEESSEPAEPTECQEGVVCSIGPLQPPRVQAIRLARVGNEANPLADTADLILEDDERAVEYRERRCLECGEELRGRQQLWCNDACRKRASRRRTL
jgi:hypothetical protein